MDAMTRMRDEGLIDFTVRRSRHLWTLQIYRAWLLTGSDAPEDQAGIDAAEAEGVGQNVVYARRPAFRLPDVVQVAGGVGV